MFTVVVGLLSWNTGGEVLAAKPDDLSLSNPGCHKLSCDLRLRSMALIPTDTEESTQPRDNRMVVGSPTRFYYSPLAKHHGLVLWLSVR